MMPRDLHGVMNRFKIVLAQSNCFRTVFYIEVPYKKVGLIWDMWVLAGGLMFDIQIVERKGTIPNARLCIVASKYNLYLTFKFETS